MVDIFKKDSVLKLLVGEFSKRKEANPRYSLRAFATHVGISQSQLSAILRGRRKPSFTQCSRVVQTLAKSVDDLEMILGKNLSQWVDSESLVVVPTKLLPEIMSESEKMDFIASGGSIPVGRIREFLPLIAAYAESNARSSDPWVFSFKFVRQLSKKKYV